MQIRNMKIIGITGGVGAGKTQVLTYISGKYNCYVILADEVAHKLKEPRQKCYLELVELLGPDILAENGQIDNGRMAEKIFSSESLLKQVNLIIHPAVKAYILSEIERIRSEGQTDFLFIEAALLIEEGYESIVDELWYIYASEEVRRKRLKASRSYSDEKINAILGNQLSEEEYKEHCRVIINNSEDLKNTYMQIDEKLEEYL